MPVLEPHDLGPACACANHCWMPICIESNLHATSGHLTVNDFAGAGARCSAAEAQSNRSLVLSIVRTIPGIQRQQIIVESGLAPTSVDYHLRRLEQQGRIASALVIGQRRYQAVKEEEVLHHSWIRADPAAQHILDYVNARPGVQTSQICRALGMTRRVAESRLRNLVGSGFVVRIKSYHGGYIPVGLLEPSKRERRSLALHGQSP